MTQKYVSETWWRQPTNPTFCSFIDMFLVTLSNLILLKAVRFYFTLSYLVIEYEISRDPTKRVRAQLQKGPQYLKRNSPPDFKLRVLDENLTAALEE